MTKEEFLKYKDIGCTNKYIGELFGLTERQVSVRMSKWELNYSNKKSVNNNFFSGSTKEVYYWAGFIAADGYVESDRPRVGIGLKKDDIGHLEKFKLAIESNHEITPFMSGAAYRIRLNSVQIVHDLKIRFNVTKQKTFTYTLPIFEDDDLLLEFLRGYIDGDGNLWKTESGRVKLSLCSANETFLSEIKSICECLLDKTVDQKIYFSQNKKGSVFAIGFTLDDSEKLINLLYKNSTEATRLERKYEVARLVLDKGIVHQ